MGGGWCMPLVRAGPCRTTCTTTTSACSSSSAASEPRPPPGPRLLPRVTSTDSSLLLLCVACVRDARRGWVRVLYEGEAAPVVMEAGDLVLQPPGIRHQVLESSDHLEVGREGPSSRPPCSRQIS